MDDAFFTTNVNTYGRPAAVQFGCVILLDTGSPQPFIKSLVLDGMKAAETVYVVCECRTPR